MGMGAFKWLAPEQVDPVLRNRWSTEGWTAMRRLRSAHALGRSTAGWQYTHAVDADRLAEGQTPPKTPGTVGEMLALPTQNASYSPLDAELWEVELQGKLHRELISPMLPPGGPTARRGRLIRRVDGWTDELAAELARDWILTARDAVAHVLRTTGAARGGAAHADRLAAAERRKDVQEAVEEIERDPNSTMSGLDRTALRALWLAVNAVINASPGAAAARAAEARALAAAARAWADQTLGESPNGFDAQRAGWVEAVHERRRISDELRERLALGPPDPGREDLPLRVKTPISATLLAAFLIGFGIMFLALGPALMFDKNLDVETLTAVAIGAGGLALIVAGLALAYGSRAVRRRRWKESSDELYGAPHPAEAATATTA